MLSWTQGLGCSGIYLLVYYGILFGSARFLYARESWYSLHSSLVLELHHQGIPLMEEGAILMGDFRRNENLLHVARLLFYHGMENWRHLCCSTLCNSYLSMTRWAWIFVKCFIHIWRLSHPISKNLGFLCLSVHNVTQ